MPKMATFAKWIEWHSEPAKQGRQSAPFNPQSRNPG